MPLTSPRFSWNLRLQAVSENNPVMRKRETGEAVRLVQQALIDLGYPMPVSTRRHGSPDGIYGTETHAKVYAFQVAQRIGRDGIVGRNTMARLDTLLPNPAPRLPALPAVAMYEVPGLKNVIAQPTNMVCWATVYSMMRSWKDTVSYDIRAAVDLVGTKYSTMFDNNQGMPPSEFGPFIRAAGLQVEPMANLPVEDWLDLLKTYGLLWVGTLATVSSGLHSRIVEGMRGDGSYGATWMMIIDPAGGRRYQESYARFWHKYETAIIGRTGTYYQIRHF